MVTGVPSMRQHAGRIENYSVVITGAGSGMGRVLSAQAALRSLITGHTVLLDCGAVAGIM